MMISRLTAYGRNILLLFVITLLSSLSFNLIGPIWPIYIKSLGASMAELGYMFAISNGVAAILQIISGSLSDKYGRKKLNAFGTFLGIFPPIFYLLARSWTDLIPWVILSGLSTGLILPIRWSMTADYSTVKIRALAYSWINIAMFLGSTVAPLFGGFIADALGLQAPFLSCFVLVTLGFVCSLLFRETKKADRKLTQTENGANVSFLSVVLIFSSLNLIQAIGVGIYNPITAVFIKDKFSVDYTGVGLLFAVGFGLSSMIVQIPGGILATKYSKKMIIVVTILLSTPFFGLFALSRTFIESIVFMFLSNAILNLSWPAFQDLLMELTPPTRRGFMNGFSATSFWIGMMIGSAISGVMWERFGMFFPYYVSAIAVLLSVIPPLFLKEAQNKTEA